MVFPDPEHQFLHYVFTGFTAFYEQSCIGAQGTVIAVEDLLVCGHVSVFEQVQKQCVSAIVIYVHVANLCKS